MIKNRVISLCRTRSFSLGSHKTTVISLFQAKMCRLDLTDYSHFSSKLLFHSISLLLLPLLSISAKRPRVFLGIFLSLPDLLVILYHTVFPGSVTSHVIRQELPFNRAPCLRLSVISIDNQSHPLSSQNLLIPKGL